MAPSIKSARGIYHLTSAAPPERLGDAWMLTLALERADGIEKFALRCRVPAPPGNAGGESAVIGNLVQLIAPLIERDFERLREEALKSIRSERRLHEAAFEDLK